MGNKITNAQALNAGIRSGFGDTEEEARKRKEVEAAKAEGDSQGMGVVGALKSFGEFMTQGDPDLGVASAWDQMTSSSKKKK